MKCKHLINGVARSIYQNHYMYKWSDRSLKPISPPIFFFQTDHNACNWKKFKEIALLHKRKFIFLPWDLWRFILWSKCQNFSVRRVAVILQLAEFYNFYMRYEFSLRFLTAWLLFDYNSTLLPENSHVHCVIILSRISITLLYLHCTCRPWILCIVKHW